MSRVKFSSILPNQLPEFVREEYPIFVKFLEYYYQYLDEQDVEITSIRDLDNTADKFVEHIKSEYNFIGTNTYVNDTVNQKELLQNIKSFYNTKGSEQSVKTLMRLMFNKEVEVLYPSEYILKASDGKWQQDTSIFINVTAGDPYITVGNKITLNGPSGEKIVVAVHRIENSSGNVYEFFLDKNFIGDIAVGYSVNFGALLGTVVNTTANSSLINAGSGFKLGQIFEIKSNTGTGTKIKITGVNSTGGITKYNVINFGTGYADSFYANLTPIATSDSTTTLSSPLTINRSGAGFGSLSVTVPGYSETTGFTEVGSLIDPNYWSNLYSDTGYSGTKLRAFYSEQLKATAGGNYATISFDLGAIARYPGAYIKNDGFLSDAMKIQDSYYYQAYSYVIRIDELLSSFRDIVKTYVHPAGMSLFSDYEVKNYISLKARVQSVISFLRRKFADEFTVSDSAPAFNTTKVLTESPTVTENAALYITTSFATETLSAPTETLFTLNTTKVFTESVGNADTITQIVLNKGIDDTATVLESGLNSGPAFNITLGTLSEGVAVSDVFDIQQNYSVTANDSAAATESGYLVLNPYGDMSYFNEQYANSRTTF